MARGFREAEPVTENVDIVTMYYFDYSLYTAILIFLLFVVIIFY